MQSAARPLSTRLHTYFNQMDLKSQKAVQQYYRIIILVVALVSFGVGHLFQRFSICIYSTLAALVLCILILSPGWPMWKKHRLTFETPSNVKKAAPS